MRIKWKQWRILFSWAPKSLWMVNTATKVKDVLAPWKRSYDQPRQCIKKQRHHLADKGPSSQSYDFSSSYVGVWGLDHKEGWTLKNWCFWTVVLEKTLESPLDCKEIKPVNPKGDQPWVFIGLMLKPQYFGYAKNWLVVKDPDAGKDWRQKEKRVAEDEMVR